MNPLALFIGRPVATTLLTVGITLAGMVSYFLLPVAPLPQVDIPTIVVYANMPGASPETMASSVATPLERHLGEIADVTEMTSTSNVGSTSVVLQFGLARDIDGAARDVQAAINAAAADLPAGMPIRPGYFKINPAEIPVLILAMTSRTLTTSQLYDAAATVIQQKLSQLEGVGQVRVSGASLPAVRVELDPRALFKYGIGMEDVRAALASANANAPKGAVEEGGLRWQIYTNDQASRAEQYRNLIVAARNGRQVRLSDVAAVDDSVENVRNIGLAGGVPAVIVQVTRQPTANIIETAERVKAALPELKASMPADIDISIPIDLTVTIRGSVKEVQRSLLISLGLVVAVVFFFLRDGRATLIPSIAVPVSVISTFFVMKLFGYSLNNLTLMALTVSTGFVVDDAIVVVENVVRLRENGMPSRLAVLQGTKEVAFTVVSMSLSLVAVFIPLLLMGGLPGRFIRTFALTLSSTIMVSLLVSLTTTPMLCALLLKDGAHHRPSPLSRWSESVVDTLRRFYAETLSVALRHPWLTLLTLVATITFNFYLYAVVPKGFVPQQDTGTLAGGMQGDQSTSFQAMTVKLKRFVDIARGDPNVADVIGFTGGGMNNAINSARMLIRLKPLKERDLTADQIIGRLRPRLAEVAGANLYLQSAQSVGGGGRQSNAQYQYTLEGEDVAELRDWTAKLVDKLRENPLLTEVNSDQDNGGLETNLVLDRDSIGRLGLTVSQVDNALYDAFGQRQVSTIFNALNQYHVVMEVEPKFWQSPETLYEIYVSTAGGAISGTHATNAVAGTNAVKNKAALSAAMVASDTVRNQKLNAIATLGRGSTSTGAAVSAGYETMIPLAAIAHFEPGTTPLSVNHQGHYVAATISYNMAPGKSLSDGETAIHKAEREIRMPVSVHGDFAGTAKFFRQTQGSSPLLLLAAIATLYIVLGILYESTIHPVTILSTLPSAGLGALLAMMAFNAEFGLISMIGILLLIGIVKKNAIMMVDFAIDAQRKRGLSSVDAIFQACMMRFRPILMTTMVALFGALPLAVGRGDGAELRQPLGISVMGGLFVSQILTLYTTPVIFLLLDNASWRKFFRGLTWPVRMLFRLAVRLT